MRNVLVCCVFLWASAAAVAVGQTTHDVDVGPGFDFSPADITIDVGDTVLWTWVAGLHDVESGVGGTPDGNFDSGDPTDVVGTTFSVTFDAAFLANNPMPGNVYPYYCIVHVAFDMIGTVTVNVPTEPDFVRGDCNVDGNCDIADAIALVDNLFGGVGAMFACPRACDMNDDGNVDIADAVYKLSALFAMGTPVPAPNTCGQDPTPDMLTCDSFAQCP